MVFATGGEAMKEIEGGVDEARRGIPPQLAKLCTSILMAILFFAVLTPIGVVTRLAGRDPLRLRLQREASSYWLTRGTAPGERQTAMTRQF
jgi:hypothetical protein